MAEQEKKVRPDTINRHVAGVYPALAMLAGMQLDVFTPLAAGPLTAEQVAAALDVDPARLRPLLYALVAGGLLEVEDGRFSNTEEAATYLVGNRPGYIGNMHEMLADLWGSTLKSAESIRSGIPQARHDFSAMSYEDLKTFMRGLDAGAGAAARRLVKSFDIARFSHVLDAGGGGGGLAMGLCRAVAGMRATVAELPNVTPVAREFVAEAGLADRITVVDADLVNGPPPGRYEAAVLRALLQVVGPDEAAAIVGNVGAAIEPGGEIFIVGRVLDDDRLAPADSVAANVMFLNVYERGQAHTEAEHRQWLADAGFTDVARMTLSGGYSVISAVRC